MKMHARGSVHWEPTKTARRGWPVSRRAAVGLLAGATVALFASSIPPAHATTYPFAPLVHYEITASTSTLYNQGEADADSIGGGKGDIWVILAFGRPAYDASLDDYGTIAYNTGSFLKNTAITSAVEAYSDGWHAGATSGGTYPHIARATTNDCYGDPAHCTDDVPDGSSPPNHTDYGVHWGDAVQTEESYILAQGYSAQSSQGGFDMEPAYDPEYTRSVDMVGGYATVQSVRDYADYGTADSSWSQSKIYHISFGIAPALPFPEVYYPNQDSMSSEWAGVDSWAHSTGLDYTIYGVLNDYHTSRGCTLTPDQTYDLLFGKIDAWQSTISYADSAPC